MRYLVLVFVALSVLGCTALEPGDEPAPGADAGVDASRRDAGSPAEDAGSELDAGADAGGVRDTGPPGEDAGPGVDSGAPSDAGIDGGCPETPTPFSRIAAGSNNSCAWNADELRCWGDNASGQIGGAVGFYGSATPMNVGPVTDACIGGRFICWTQGQTIECRGGGPDLGSSTFPLTHDESIEALFCGLAHVCFIDSSNDLYCFGANNAGQCGGATLSLPTPFPTPGTEATAVGVARAAAGDDFTCYTRETTAGGRSAGTFCFGNPASFDPSEPLPTLPPEEPLLSRAALLISAGPTSFCHYIDGFVDCDGDDEFNAAYSAVSGLSVGAQFGCVLGVRNSGAERLRCEGSNMQRQLGQTAANAREVTIESTDCTVLAEIASGTHHTCVRVTDGRVFCFGANGFGQLGRMTTLGFGPLGPVTVPP